MHCRKSLLFFGNETWKKKSTESCFDVTMGSFDGAEICELVGLYIQSNLENILPKTNFGLYRDHELILLRNLNGQQMDKKRKTIIKIFKDIGFSIDIQTNLKEVDFLDVTLNLQNGTYRPYKKANDKLLYIHSSSNHPPQIIKQLPNSISERLSKNSSNQEVFNTAKVEYEDALKKSGYNVDLKYTDSNNTIKVSYNCMNNMSNIIKGHNKKSSRNHMTKDQNAIAEKKQNVQWKETVKLTT